jgi:hypothetical protein
MKNFDIKFFDFCSKDLIFLVFTLVVYCTCVFNFNYGLFRNNEIQYMQGGLTSILATTESIVERKTFIIDGSTFSDTIDKMKVGDHFYSDKAPGFSLLLVPAYFMLHKFGLVIAEQKFVTISLLTIFGVVLPGILCLYYFPQMAGLFYADANKRQIRITRNLLAFGTIFISFSGMLNYHLMAAFLLMLLVVSVQSSEEKHFSVLQSLATGFVLGILITFDIPTGGIFTLMVGLYFIAQKKYRLIILIAVGAALPVLTYIIINYSIIGKLLPPFFYRQEFYQFKGSMHTALSLSGEEGTDNFFNLKRFYKIYRNFFGSIGLLSLSPILILAILGHISNIKKSFKSLRNTTQKFGFYLGIGVILQILFYNCIVPSATGTVYGVRHILPVIPYIILGYIPFLTYFSMKKIYRGIIIISIIFSIGGAFEHKDNFDHLWGWRQFVPAYSFVHSMAQLTNYSK